MRVTKETKRVTRERILKSASKLFSSRGFEEATTRDIARQARIASGTLFNYFPTKEAIALALVQEALERAQETFDRRVDKGASLEEALFAFIATGLRYLKPHRRFVHPVLDTVLSPSAKGNGGAGEALRLQHLESLQELVAEYGGTEPLSAIALQLYWTLYTGVLAFSATDPSENQEDTLAMLDGSLNMFVQWLNSNCENGYAR